jgi:DNA-binding response OmpR family regulator
MSSGARSPHARTPERRLRVRPFLLEARERRLLRDGQPVPLTVKVFDLLEVLVRRPDRLLHKEELLRLVWPDAVVEENNFNVTMSALRKARWPQERYSARRATSGSTRAARRAGIREASSATVTRPTATEQ